MQALIVMGVAGCGKSSVGHAVAQALGWRLVEGDDFHSAANRDKMSRGVALTDEDRADWLAALGDQIRQADTPIVLTCSALKLDYRERLRRAGNCVGFLFLRLDRDAALQRVAARGDHFFSPTLVDSQFAALEAPDGENGVLTLDAAAPLAQVTSQALRWLQQEPTKETR
ncbi:gluconokinase [Variovorax sp.]|uniref:gluconokinase n=1 Tax=Variovorax sp. TaxID=1871043 RepID=UPI002D598064|nr:gluconokinase [Variovorax sp.]HYP86341.1 gluconokinase [Variovorax sp.]